MTLCVRCQAELEEPFAYPPEIDVERHVVRSTGAHIRPVQMDILGILWKRRGTVVSQETLLRLVWGQNPPSADAVVREHIRVLRKALKGSPYAIVTRYPRWYEKNGGWMIEE
jgi:DNA-binding response OmpR family regulator